MKSGRGRGAVRRAEVDEGGMIIADINVNINIDAGNC